MRVVIGSTIRITNPSKAVLSWCKQELELPNPDYGKKLRMGLYTGKTPPVLYLYEVRGEDVIVPYGTLKHIPVPPMTEIVKDFPYWSSMDEVRYGLPLVSLYDYQQDAVKVMLKHHVGILQAPAGSGKTQMGIAMLKNLKRKTLWITHTADLLQQSMDRAKIYIQNPELIGTTTDGKCNISKGVTFATVQTLCRMDLSQLKHYWDVIIVDECHRVSGTPTSMTMFSKVLNSLAARYKYGLSATVHRADGLIRATHALLGDTVYTVPENAVADRIMKVGVLPIGTETGISSKCLNPDGTLDYPGMVNYLAADERRNELIVSNIVENRDHSSLILSARVGHLRTLMKMMPQPLQRYCVMIDGSMQTKEGRAFREAAIEDMRSGRKRFLFATYALAKEGLDIPRLENLYMTTPQKDYAVVVQSVGRVARVCDGKSDPVVFDFVDKIPMLMRYWKIRCRHYRKCNAYIIGEGEH